MRFIALETPTDAHRWVVGGGCEARVRVDREVAKLLKVPIGVVQDVAKGE
jgi:hypothetical protein